MPRTLISLDFSASARYTPGTAGTGSNIYGDEGIAMTTGTTASSHAYIEAAIAGSNSFTIFDGNPIFSAVISCDTLDAANGAGECFVGVADMPPAAGVHTFTTKHFGFKIIKAGGAVNLIGTQADGTTELVTANLTTLADNDVLDLIAVSTSGTSVDYYYRKNGGTLSSVITLSGNMPSGTNRTLQASTGNKATAYAFAFTVSGMKYER